MKSIRARRSGLEEIGGIGARIRRLLGRAATAPQTEAELIRAAGEYWNGALPPGVEHADYSHWQGAGPWRDRERWLALGRPHVRLVAQLRAMLGSAATPCRIVEWGCGGGANAVHFAGQATEFCGIEISQASLDECARVLHAAGNARFRPVLIPAGAPEQALDAAGDGYDLFVCTYVFELIPSRAYGERVLETAVRLLRPGGLALVQIRYDDGTARSTQKQRDYERDCARFTSYRIEDFWTLAQRIGFEPVFVWLAPEQTPEFSGDLYAYFGLRRPLPSPAAGSDVAEAATAGAASTRDSQISRQ